jgi:hypothetical protein
MLEACGTSRASNSRLALLRRGRAVGCAGSLSFAAVLACMLCVAAALTLAIVLALAGVLGGSGGRILRDQEDASVG